MSPEKQETRGPFLWGSRVSKGGVRYGIVAGQRLDGQ